MHELAGELINHFLKNVIEPISSLEKLMEFTYSKLTEPRKLDDAIIAHIRQLPLWCGNGFLDHNDVLFRDDDAMAVTFGPNALQFLWTRNLSNFQIRRLLEILDVPTLSSAVSENVTWGNTPIQQISDPSDSIFNPLVRCALCCVLAKKFPADWENGKCQKDAVKSLLKIGGENKVTNLRVTPSVLFRDNTLVLSVQVKKHAVYIDMKRDPPVLHRDIGRTKEEASSQFAQDVAKLCFPSHEESQEYLREFLENAIGKTPLSLALKLKSEFKIPGYFMALANNMNWDIRIITEPEVGPTTPSLEQLPNELPLSTPTTETASNRVNEQRAYLEQQRDSLMQLILNSKNNPSLFLSYIMECAEISRQLQNYDVYTISDDTSENTYEDAAYVIRVRYVILVPQKQLADFFLFRIQFPLKVKYHPNQ